MLVRYMIAGLLLALLASLGCTPETTTQTTTQTSATGGSTAARGPASAGPPSQDPGQLVVLRGIGQLAPLLPPADADSVVHTVYVEGLTPEIQVSVESKVDGQEKTLFTSRLPIASPRPPTGYVVLTTPKSRVRAAT